MSDASLWSLSLSSPCHHSVATEEKMSQEEQEEQEEEQEEQEEAEGSTLLYQVYLSSGYETIKKSK